jgi:hypothetical protein
LHCTDKDLRLFFGEIAKLIRERERERENPKDISKNRQNPKQYTPVLGRGHQKCLEFLFSQKFHHLELETASPLQ